MEYRLEKEWEFNYLSIYNYKKEGKLSPLIDYIKKIPKDVRSNIAEFGVYKGSLSLGIALLLKEIGLDCKVHGFDSFSGFPPIFSFYDDLKRFEDLFFDKKITEEHFSDILKLQQYKSFFDKIEPSTQNLSTSGDFSDSNYELIKKKINFFNLDNVILHPGVFSQTLGSKVDSLEYVAAIIDCDLHDSYKISLEYIWPRLVSGGLLYLDEYYSLKYPGAKICVDNFLEDKDYELTLFQSDTNFPRCYVKKN